MLYVLFLSFFLRGKRKNICDLISATKQFVGFVGNSLYNFFHSKLSGRHDFMIISSMPDTVSIMSYMNFGL